MADIEEIRRLAEDASNRKDWPVAVDHWTKVVDRLGGPQAPKKIRARLWQARREQNSQEALRRNRLVFKALADDAKLIWVDPQRIRYKVHALADVDLYQNAILPGDWDLDVISTTETAKYQSIEQHFVQGVPWQDTQLFQKYARLLESGKLARGRDTMERVLADYEQVDALYEDMRRRGFVLPDPDKRRPEDVPHVHIGRAGEVLYGRAGNHRLAIGKILGLKHIGCYVRARHSDWQDLRERIFSLAPENRRAQLGPELADHPDLADILH